MLGHNRYMGFFKTNIKGVSETCGSKVSSQGKVYSLEW